MLREQCYDLQLYFILLSTCTQGYFLLSCPLSAGFITIWRSCLDHDLQAAQGAGLGGLNSGFSGIMLGITDG